MPDLEKRFHFDCYFKRANEKGLFDSGLFHNLTTYILGCILIPGRYKCMHTTKVFTSGNSQAIRLPKDYQVEEKEMFIQKVGTSIILFPKSDPWKAFEESLTEFTDDFFKDGRNQPELKNKEDQNVFD